MELSILSSTKTEIGKIKLPTQFEEEIRPDLIKRAVLSIQSHKRQPYGADKLAGKRASATISKRRRNYRGCYGIGISRTPRKIMSRRGTRMNWVGAFVSGTVGGMKAHPPKAEKKWEQKLNKKERRKAIRSAIAATLNKQYVKNRGHILPDDYPFILESKIESTNKTNQAKELLEKLGFKEELERTGKKKIRAGKGKLRGRKYKTKRGPLLVVSEDCRLSKAAANIPSVEVCNVKNLNAETLAPGAVPGRLTIFTDKSIQILEKERLFSQ
ncbi:50S ribosomal protein L4 [Candidatus Woesearchaeota archaeon]|jgi:large subunit ribosomal protein L4e|nr:50S ribosomal protein L4 [Candidatus Woesearchaeota archaeon]|tara:strand:+ start:3198 stop:4007 length:810 start_codon:yes stop_codon:yes gene_type:complete